MRRDGFTLLELITSLVVMAFVMTSLVQAFTRQQQNAMAVEQVTEMQQNVRVVADLIEREVRNAGYRVPHKAAVCVKDVISFHFGDWSDRLFIADTSAISTVDELYDPDVDAASKIAALDPGRPLGSSILNHNSGNGYLASDSTVLQLDSLDLERSRLDPEFESDFVVGAGVIVTERFDSRVDTVGNVGESFTGSVGCGTVVAVDEGASRLVVNFKSGSNHDGGGQFIKVPPPPAELVAIPAVVYQVDGEGVLRRNDSPLLASIEDLQVSVFLDMNQDTVEDPGERFGDGWAGPGDTSPDGLTALRDYRSIREVRVNLVGMTRREDQNWEHGVKQSTENRRAPSGHNLNPDGRRRRVHSSNIYIRNAGTGDE